MKDTLLYKVIVGSQSYGTSTPQSDVDYKSVFAQDLDKIVSFGYTEQVNYTSDDVGYEIRRFLELCEKGNPSAIEMLFVPHRCIVEKSPLFDIILENRDKFITKKLVKSFKEMAYSQIVKATGLNKKLNWEKEKITRKTPLDFCYVYENGQTKPITQYLDDNGMVQENCGLAKLNHFKDAYALYYDLNFKGIAFEQSNEVRLSNIPKEHKSLTVLYYNKDAYTMHCSNFLEYTKWLKNRNTDRYVDNDNHGQKIDGKNMMHCVRLLDMSLEILADKKIIIERPNVEYLLSIKKGDVNLLDIKKYAEETIVLVNESLKISDLPDEVEPTLIYDLLLAVRKQQYINYV